uniref:Ubiquitin associated protein 2a n=1 Tax=Scleropages formosus TaxID=113540 RepID=A0A8C9TY90_SCLFO
MMTSLVSERPRGTRDKALPTAPQAAQPQKQIQATAEQIRLAQMIYDNNDADFEDKVKQLMEVTGKNQDECMVALHDCNEDVNRAINFLLEGSSDTNLWETVGKKRSIGKEGSSSDKENKETREKKGEREASRGRGGTSRKGRGASRSREGKCRGLLKAREQRCCCNLIFVLHCLLPHTLLCILGSGFGNLGSSKLAQSAGSQMLEQLKGPGLGQLPTQQPVSVLSSVPTSSWDIKPLVSQNTTPLSSQFSRDFKTQPEPSLVLSQLTQRQQNSLSQARPGSPPTLPATSTPGFESFSKPQDTSPPHNGPSTVGKLLGLSTGAAAPQPATAQHRQMKTQKRKIPPTSKIPSSAVEMPGSADVSGLNVQFGALDFGPEATLPDFGQAESCTNSISSTTRESIPVPQALNSLYSKPNRYVLLCVYGAFSLVFSPNSEPLGSPLSLPLSSSDSSYASPAVSLSSLPSALPPAISATPSSSTSGSSFETSATTHSHLTFSQSKDPAAPSVTVSSCHSGTRYKVETLNKLLSKAPPNLAQGVPPLLPNQYIMGPGGLLPAYPIYGYEDLQMLQSRLPMDYYGITFPGPAATLTGRDGGLANSPYSGEMTKFGRGDSASPAPPTSLSAQQQQQNHHGSQQAFLNPALPPGYGYTGLPYYPGVPGVPSAFQYGPTMFVPPTSAKQHGVGLSNPSTQFQQPAGYGQHTYGSGFDDLTQGPAGGEYSKGSYSGSSQAQAKSAASGPGKGISVTSSNAGGPDLSGSVYNKAQSFEKQGFHTGTPPPFSLPSALGGTGPLNPGAAPGYAPAPFLHILPAHQQPHSQLLHHHHTQDNQGGPSQRNQSSSMQQKTQATKSTYGSSPYWAN